MIDFWGLFLSETVLVAEYLGNSVAAYLGATVVFIAALVVLFVVRSVALRFLARLAERTQTDFDDMLIGVVKEVRPAFYAFVAVYVALTPLAIPNLLHEVLTGVLIAWIVYRIIRSLQTVIDYVVEKKCKKQDSREGQQALRYLSRIGKWALWIVGILLVLGNLGINITSLVAGLGIGGLAVAIALQSILADLFSSFSIFFDKPFIVGDFIMVGEHVGTVERIGIKTTRIRALSGEEIIIANAELTAARVHNFGRISERRAVVEIGVLYETPIEKLKKIPELCEQSVSPRERARFDRAHLARFGDSALVYELVYYVTTQDYNEFMDTQQAINLALLEAFAKEKIEFAYPTRTVYMQK